MLCNALCQYRLKNPLPYVHIPGQCFSPLATQHRIRTGVGRAASLVLHERSALTHEATFKGGSYDRVLRKRRQACCPPAIGNVLRFLIDTAGPDSITIASTGVVDLRGAARTLSSVAWLEITDPTFASEYFPVVHTQAGLQIDPVFLEQIFSGNFGTLSLRGTFSQLTRSLLPRPLHLAGGGGSNPVFVWSLGPFSLLGVAGPSCHPLVLVAPIDALTSYPTCTCHLFLVFMNFEGLGVILALYLPSVPLLNYPAEPASLRGTIAC